MATKDSLRRWNQEEVELLINLVKDNYDHLTEALSNCKTKPMIDGKWNDIAATINSLGHGPPFTTEKVKKKWFDLKSRAKRDVAMYKKEAGRTGGGQNPFNNPTELQFKIANIIGAISTEGIGGTNLCDTSNSYYQSLSDSAAAVSLSSTQLNSHPQEANTSGSFNNEEEDASPPPSKRARTAAGKREAQGEEMLKIEKNIEAAVLAMNSQMTRTNDILGSLVQEIRRTNNILEIFVSSSSASDSTMARIDEEATYPSLPHFEHL